MKLKRFLALAVSAIMVLAMVPAMSVSAAGTTGVIDALGGEVLWACPDGSFNDTPIATAFEGWTSSATAGNVMKKMLSECRNIQWIEPVITISSSMNKKNTEELSQLAEKLFSL